MPDTVYGKRFNGNKQKATPNRQVRAAFYVCCDACRSYPMIRIFLAHASEDKAAVTDLYNRLEASGFEPWLDKINLLPGQRWQDEIPKAIKNSHVFIACLSEKSVQKQGYIQREFKMALNEMADRPSGYIYLIPLRLDNCQIPELRQEEYGISLSDYQWVDLYEPNGYDRLVQGIRAGFPDSVEDVSLGGLVSSISVDSQALPISSAQMKTTDGEGIDWDNTKRKAFRLALQAVYPQKADLELFVADELDENIAEIADDTTLNAMTYSLIKWARAKGKLDTLFQAFCRENPNHPIIIKLQGDSLAKYERPQASAALSRLQLIKVLNGLPPTQFEELVIALNPPSGIVPSGGAAQGMRSSALMQWIEGPTGPGINELQVILNHIIAT